MDSTLEKNIWYFYVTLTPQNWKHFNTWDQFSYHSPWNSLRHQQNVSLAYPRDECSECPINITHCKKDCDSQIYITGSLLLCTNKKAQWAQEIKKETTVLAIVLADKDGY